MKFEYSFGLIFLSVLIGVIALFSSLFEKYTYLTVFHFAQSCTQTLTTFLSSPYHWAGITILSLGLVLSSYFVIKLLLSTFKTHQKMKHFTRVKLTVLPRKVKHICQLRNLDVQTLMVVKNPQPVAFAMGIFSQKIVVTSGLVKLLPTAELEAVLLHEQYHLLHRHSLLLLSAEIISSTLSFLPSLFDILHQMRAQLEHAADAYAVNIQATEQPLLNAIQRVMAFDQPAQFSPAFGLTVVEQRIHKLTHQRYTAPVVSKWRGAATTLSVLTFCLLLAAPAQTQAVTAPLTNSSLENCGDGLLCSIRCRTTESPLASPSQSVEQYQSPR